MWYSAAKRLYTTRGGSQNAAQLGARMSAADHAYEFIRGEILSGRFAGGARLREERLVEMCGVSRTPVREALRRLEVEGFIETEPRQGARVTQWTWQEIEEVFELRAVLESHGAALAARHVTAVQLEALRRNAEDIEDAYAARDSSFAAQFIKANAAFHEGILTAAQRPRLTQMVAQLALPPTIFRTLGLYDDVSIQRSMAQHRDLIAALEAGDVNWARAIMEAHLRAAKQTIISELEARALVSGADGGLAALEVAVDGS